MNILSQNFEEFVKNISTDDEHACKVDEVCKRMHDEIYDFEYDGSTKSFIKGAQIENEASVAFMIPQEIDEKSAVVEIDGCRIHVETVHEDSFKSLEGYDNDNFLNIIKMVKHWKKLHGVRISPYLIEKTAYDYITGTYHDTDSYLLYNFMLMKYFEELLDIANDNWVFEVGEAYRLCEKAVLFNEKEKSIECLRKLFGDAFPEKIYE